MAHYLVLRSFSLPPPFWLSIATCLFVNRPRCCSLLVSFEGAVFFLPVTLFFRVAGSILTPVFLPSLPLVLPCLSGCTASLPDSVLTTASAAGTCKIGLIGGSSPAGCCHGFCIDIEISGGDGCRGDRIGSTSLSATNGRGLKGVDFNDISMTSL